MLSIDWQTCKGASAALASPDALTCHSYDSCSPGMAGQLALVAFPVCTEYTKLVSANLHYYVLFKVEAVEAVLEQERKASNAKDARHKLTVERLRQKLVELQVKQTAAKEP